MDVAGGQDAAQRVALMLVAQIGQALGGDWSRVERVVKLGVFVNSAPGFTDQAKVANGASELFETPSGEAGRPARAAVSVRVRPLGVAVEARSARLRVGEEWWCTCGSRLYASH